MKELLPEAIACRRPRIASFMELFEKANSLHSSNGASLLRLETAGYYFSDY